MAAGSVVLPSKGSVKLVWFPMMYNTLQTLCSKQIFTRQAHIFGMIKPVMIAHEYDAVQ